MKNNNKADKIAELTLSPYGEANAPVNLQAARKFWQHFLPNRQNSLYNNQNFLCQQAKPPPQQATPSPTRYKIRAQVHSPQGLNKKWSQQHIGFSRPPPKASSTSAKTIFTPFLENFSSSTAVLNNLGKR